jgi:Fe-Mn family superoxide dismutase
MRTYLALITSFVFAITLSGCGSTSHPLPNPAPGTGSITYSLPSLPYPHNALEPSIDERTMVIHHTKHHQAYVDNLNKALKGTPQAAVPLDSILASVSAFPPAVRNNAGGTWNHSFFWKIMTPAKSSGAPSPKLLAAINASFGSLDAFKEKFNSAATGRFGSGWAWLVKTPAGLVITSTPNQDNPLMDVAEVRGTPILGVDVWEHAYYLKYQNKRADYLKEWWKVVNWSEVSRMYEAS